MDSASNITPALSPQEWLFVEKYIELGFNQTKAAVAAKYASRSARNQGYRLMKNDDIRQAIEARLSTLAMSQNEVLARLADHARGDMGDFANVHSARTLAKHPNSNLIKKFKRTITSTTTGRDDARETITEEKIEVELYSSQDALIQIGRYHKLFTDNMDMTTGGEKLIAPTVFLPAVDSDES